MSTVYDEGLNAGPNTIPVQSSQGEIESVCYYTVSGIKTLTPVNGVYIKVVRYRSGHVDVSEILVRDGLLS